MTGTISPWWAQQWFDNNGDPLSSGKIYTYASGTVTALATYTDATLGTENANPVILDSSGRASIFLGPSSYKFVLKDSTDVTILTVDGIAAVPLTNIDLDIVGTAGQDLAMNDVVFLSDGTGGNTAGRWYKTDSDATLSSTLAKAIGVAPAAILTGESGSIRRSGRVTSMAGLNPGTNYYISATAGAITSTAPDNAVLVGTADSTTSLLVLGTGYVVNPYPTTLSHYAGTGTGYGPAPVRVSTNVVSAGNVNAAETYVHNHNLPGNSLNGDGDTCVYRVAGSFAANANNKSINCWFGASAFAIVPSAGYNGVKFSVEMRVVRVSATTQRGVCTALVNGQSAMALTSTSIADTLSGNLTCQVGIAGTTTNDVIVEMSQLSVE